MDHWHGWIGDDTIADAILDRVSQRVQKILLKGESLRRPTGKRPGRDGDAPVHTTEKSAEMD